MLLLQGTLKSKGMNGSKKG